MELHKEYLKNLCRVCGKKCGKGYFHDKQGKAALLSAFNIEVEVENDSVHPPSVCHCCFVTITKILTAKERGSFTLSLENGFHILIPGSSARILLWSPAVGLKNG